MLELNSDSKQKSDFSLMRYKVYLKGLVSKYWSVMKNDQVLFHVNTNQDRVQLGRDSGIIALATITNKINTGYSHLPLPRLKQFFSNISFSKDYVLRYQLNSNISVTIENPIDIERFHSNSFLVSILNLPTKKFNILKVASHDNFHSWSIQKDGMFSNPLIRFTWFGKLRSDNSFAGLELYKPFTELEEIIFTTIIMVYFKECQRLEMNQKALSNFLFCKGYNPCRIHPQRLPSNYKLSFYDN